MSACPLLLLPPTWSACHHQLPCQPHPHRHASSPARERAPARPEHYATMPDKMSNSLPDKILERMLEGMSDRLSEICQIEWQIECQNEGQNTYHIKLG